MEFSSVIKSRESIRDYSSKKVEDKNISYVLECARFAPSWTNKQCWHFIVVKDEKIIKELSKTSIINRWLKNAPIVIVACGDPKQSGVRNNINYFMVDVSIALEHIVLAATDKGLGTCWIGGFSENKVKKILERIRIRPESFVTKIVGDPGFRLRVGEYRVIVDIDKNKLLILVIKIGHRTRIYKKM